MLHLVAKSVYPLHHARLLSRSAPITRHLHFITQLPQGKRHVARTYARHGPVVLRNHHPEPLRRILRRGCNRRDSGLVQLGKEQVRHEICRGLRGSPAFVPEPSFLRSMHWLSFATRLGTLRESHRSWLQPLGQTERPGWASSRRRAIVFIARDI